MSHWIGACVVRPLIAGRRFALREDFGFKSSLAGRAFHIPPGFLTDFASIPRILWSLLPPFGTYMAAALLHDWLYWSQATTRREADDVFYDAMVLSGVDGVTRSVVYRAVRLFGGFAWRANQKAKARGETRIFDPATHTFLAVLPHPDPYTLT